MRWEKDARRKHGGGWRCRVRACEKQRRYRQTEKGRATKRAGDRTLAQTPGTYRYKAKHGIGLPGLKQRLRHTRWERNQASAKDLEKIAQLEKELRELG